MLIIQNMEVHPLSDHCKDGIVKGKEYGGCRSIMSFRADHRSESKRARSVVPAYFLASHFHVFPLNQE